MLEQGDIELYDFIVLSLYLGHRVNETMRVRLSESPANPYDPYCDGSDFVIFPDSTHANKTTYTHHVPVRPIVAEVINRRYATAKESDRVHHPGQGGEDREALRQDGPHAHPRAAP
jgi:hypothetical protein